jgi:hypothetical protein
MEPQSIHKGPSLARILSKMNPVHTLRIYIPKIVPILFSHLRVGTPNGILPSGFPTKIL